MKQHGITPSSAGAAGVKKEAKEAKDPKDPPKSRKKRKLAKVEDDVGDIDEPVKGEVKNEDAVPVKTELVKSKAAATVGVKSEPVKTEYVVAAAVAGLDAPTSTSSPEAGAVGARKNDDDDEVLVVSATRRSDASTPMMDFSDIHRYRQHARAHSHSHSHSHSPMPAMVPGVQSFDYGANMSFPTQTMPTTMTSTMPQASSNPSTYPYGFGPSPWFHPHDAASSIYGGHGHFWQGMSTQEPQHQQHHSGEDHDTAMEG